MRTDTCETYVIMSMEYRVGEIVVSYEKHAVKTPKSYDTKL